MPSTDDGLWRSDDYDDEPRSHGNFGLDPCMQMMEAEAEVRKRTEFKRELDLDPEGAGNSWRRAMNQKRSEQSWDEIFAALDAAGPFPDDFLSETDRDMRPPEPRPAVDELFVEEHRKGKKTTDAQD